MTQLVKFPRLFRFRGVDVLHSATVYLKNEFRIDMTYDEAFANLQSRALLATLQNKLLDQIEKEEKL